MDKKSASVETWTAKITEYDREFRQWNAKVGRIIRRYRAENKTTTGNHVAQFNILWSNVQTLIPAVFARLPRPDVSRKFSDNDPVARVASMILERGLCYEIEHYHDYRSAVKSSVQDRFLGGRGCAWVRYEPHFKPLEVAAMPEDGFQITEDADDSGDIENDTESQEPQEEIDYECSPVDYVHWKDFGHSYARTWEEVQTIWRAVYMDRDALVERFGEELGNQIPLDTSPEKELKSQGLASTNSYQACIYEIWDKPTNKAYWVSKSMPTVLDEREDPLELEGFWPCPRPLYATLTNDSLVPVPDFLLYQDQAVSLDLIAERIEKLIQSLQVKGVHDAAVPELARLFTEAGNTDLIPVDNWMAFSEKNGLRGAIDLVDLIPIVNALQAAYKAQEEVKNQIFEIMGIADILRGASDPNETYGAQKMKGQFGSLRLKAMRADVEQYATEILHIKAQIMCQMYQPETLVQISAVAQLSPQDQQLVPQAMELLKNKPLRNFRIEISSDSMVQMDEMQEKADRLEFLKAAGGFIQNIVQLSAAPVATELMPLTVSMMKYGVTAFKVGRILEGEFDETVDRMKEAAKQPKPPAPPPPQIQIQQMKMTADAQKFQAEQAMDQQKVGIEHQMDMQKMQAELEAERQRLAMEAQARAQESQNEMQVEQHKQEMQAQQSAHLNELEAQRAQMQNDNEMRLEQFRLMMEKQAESSRQQFELILARLDHANKIEIAEINKTAKISSDQISAANYGANTDEGQEPYNPIVDGGTPNE